MRRRQLIAGLGCAALAAPFAARAQQTARLPRVSAVIGTNENDGPVQSWIAGFENALNDLGWSPGRTINLNYHWARGDVARLRAIVAAIAQEPPDVVFALGTFPMTMVKPAITSVPVVFAVVNDPVAQGFVSSLAKPGGNVTGFSLMDYSVLGKAMELLGQLAPAITSITLMFNPDTYPYYDTYLKSVQASTTPFKVAALHVHSAAEIEAGIANLPSGSGIVAAPDSFTTLNRTSIIRATERHRIPATYPYRHFVIDGGLMAYGPDPQDIVRRSASYVDRILKGAKPEDLPVQAPTKFEFLINAKTAKALGLQVPSSLLFTADEVIE
jgi:putative ABC transport system substrate-binding protein